MSGTLCIRVRWYVNNIHNEFWWSHVMYIAYYKRYFSMLIRSYIHDCNAKILGSMYITFFCILVILMIYITSTYLHTQ
jgi:hypothetical protein